MPDPDVVIVGAGLAGLCCARKLQQQGVSFRLIEASNAPGGRVRTDHLDGFVLDRGFQVLFTAYPEAMAQLNYETLELHPFPAGVIVRHQGGFYRVIDPWREPGSIISGLFSPVLSLVDKIRLAALRNGILHQTMEQIFEEEETSTRQALLNRGFTHRSLDRFFRTFLGGITLDSKLGTSSRLFKFLFQMMADGDVALPAAGMQAIPDQLAAALPPGSLVCNERVTGIDGSVVKLASGSSLRAAAVVVATEGAEAGQLIPSFPAPPSRSVCCLYFSANEPPHKEPYLVLSGGSRGPINNLAIPNLVAPSYAPPGEFLVSVTVLGWPSRDDQTLVGSVRSQLKRWYGLVADEWRFLRLYRIEQALPIIPSMTLGSDPRLRPRLYVCGDHCSTPSIQGAMESGRLAAESLLRELRGEPEPKRETGKTSRAAEAHAD